MIIITDDCMGCGFCVEECPSSAIESKANYQYEIKQDLCTGCETCLSVDCPAQAIIIKEE